MSAELDMLARWAVLNYAANRDSEDALMEPLLTVVGGDYDALTTPGNVIMGESSVDSLAFLIGYIGYPCDAVYLTCTWEAISVERPVEEVTATLIPADLEADETTRTALLCWAHSIPTRETVLLILNRHIDDKGEPHWLGVQAPPATGMDIFAPLTEAAHCYDDLPIVDHAAFGRQAAMRVLIDLNGDTHDSLFYEPGTLLEAARNHG
jgi:hypothetical protein